MPHSSESVLQPITVGKCSVAHVAYLCSSGADCCAQIDGVLQDGLDDFVVQMQSDMHLIEVTYSFQFDVCMLTFTHAVSKACVSVEEGL